MNDETKQDKQTTLFQTLVLNAWAESDRNLQEVNWRFRLHHIRNDELTTFASLDALLDYLTELFKQQPTNEE